MNTRDRAHAILADLDAVQENLLALSDDIWLSIDHNDPEALERGVRFKQRYNEKLAAFRTLAGELAALLDDFPAGGIANDRRPVEVSESDHRRLVREMDQAVPHRLNEDFRYKRPSGFVLQGRAFHNTTTWRHIYQVLLEQLARLDRERYLALPDEPRFVSSRGNPMFSRQPETLRSPLPLPGGIYAEVNLSANNICALVRDLLDYFEIGEDEMTVYLREDRDARE